MRYGITMYRVPESRMWLVEASKQGEYYFGFMAPRNKILKFIRNFMVNNGR